MRAATAYKRVSDNTAVMAADAVGLVVLLYEKLLLRLREVGVAIDTGDIAARGKSTGAAIEIISAGLIGALDMDRGGSVASHLRQQYEIWLHMLLKLNLSGDANLLRALERGVSEVLSAWRELQALRLK